MAIFNQDGIGIDLGSMHTSIFLCRENAVVLREPTLSLVSADSPDEVLTVGTQAREMVGRTTRDTILLSPMRMGAVADVELCALLMVALAEKAAQRKKPMDRATLVSGLPGGATKTERAALFQAMNATGARRVAALRGPIAAAIGADVDIAQPRGRMIVTLGANVTEIAVISMNGIAALRRLYFGGQDLDEAIASWFWRRKQIVISLRTAERLKREIGAISDDAIPEDEDPVLLRGKDALTGAPATLQISAYDILEALQESAQRLLDAMRSALYNAPAELSADIMANGLTVSGGGALLRGLKERLQRETGLPVTMSPHPQDDVAVGLGVAAGNDALLRDLIRSGAAESTGD